MKDWRGNTYQDEVLGVPCANCGKPAMRNCCIAEGDVGRTHWHGEVHIKGLKPLCKSCAEEENKKWK